MIYKRLRKGVSEPGGFIHLEDQRSHRKVAGFGMGGQIRLADQAGTTNWTGTAERNDDKTIYYRLRDSDGRMITGLGDGDYLMLRDERGCTWKGFVD
jgi:hypothetical protein